MNSNTKNNAHTPNFQWTRAAWAVAKQEGNSFWGLVTRQSASGAPNISSSNAGHWLVGVFQAIAVLFFGFKYCVWGASMLLITGGTGVVEGVGILGRGVVAAFSNRKSVFQAAQTSSVLQPPPSPDAKKPSEQNQSSQLIDPAKKEILDNTPSSVIQDPPSPDAKKTSEQNQPSQLSDLPEQEMPLNTLSPVIQDAPSPEENKELEKKQRVSLREEAKREIDTKKNIDYLVRKKLKELLVLIDSNGLEQCDPQYIVENFCDKTFEYAIAQQNYLHSENSNNHKNVKSILNKENSSKNANDTGESLLTLAIRKNIAAPADNQKNFENIIKLCLNHDSVVTKNNYDSCQTTSMDSQLRVEISDRFLNTNGKNRSKA